MDVKCIDTIPFVCTACTTPDTPDKCRVRTRASPLDIKIHTVPQDLIVFRDQITVTYPSSTALPKGLVELEPPRKVFQMVSAKDSA